MWHDHVHCKNTLLTKINITESLRNNSLTKNRTGENTKVPRELLLHLAGINDLVGVVTDRDRVINKVIIIIRFTH